MYVLYTPPSFFLSAPRFKSFPPPAEPDHLYSHSTESTHLETTRASFIGHGVAKIGYPPFLFRV